MTQPPERQPGMPYPQGTPYAPGTPPVPGTPGGPPAGAYPPGNQPAGAYPPGGPYAQPGGYPAQPSAPAKKNPTTLLIAGVGGIGLIALVAALIMSSGFGLWGGKPGGGPSATVPPPTTAAPKPTPSVTPAVTSLWVGLWRYSNGTDLELFNIKADGTFVTDVYNRSLSTHDQMTGKYVIAPTELKFSGVQYNGTARDDFSFPAELKGDQADIAGFLFSRVPPADVARVLADPLADYSVGNVTPAPQTGVTIYEPQEWERQGVTSDVEVRTKLQPGSNMPEFTIQVFSLEEQFGQNNAGQGYKLKQLTVTNNTNGEKVIDVTLPDIQSLTFSGGLRFIDYTFDGYADLVIQNYSEYGDYAYSPESEGYMSYRLFTWLPDAQQFQENESFAAIPSPAAVPAQQQVYSHLMGLVDTVQYDVYTKFTLVDGVFQQGDMLIVSIEPKESGDELLTYQEQDPLGNPVGPPITFTRPPRSSDISGDAQKYYVPGSTWDLNSDMWICSMQVR